MKTDAKLIFDWSGTISDDFDIVLAAINKVSSFYGKQPITSSELKGSYSADSSFLWRRFRIPVDEATQRFKEYLRSGEEPKQIPGAIEIVNGLINLFPVTILTTHPQDLVERESRRYGLRECMILGGVKKAHPCETLEKQIEGLNKNRVIYVGDTLVDVELAKVYKLVSVALAHKYGYHEQEILEHGEPNKIIHSLEEFPLLVNNILEEIVA